MAPPRREERGGAVAKESGGGAGGLQVPHRLPGGGWPPPLSGVEEVGAAGIAEEQTARIREPERRRSGVAVYGASGGWGRISNGSCTGMSNGVK